MKSSSVPREVIGDDASQPPTHGAAVQGGAAGDLFGVRGWNVRDDAAGIGG